MGWDFVERVGNRTAARGSVFKASACFPGESPGNSLTDWLRVGSLIEIGGFRAGSELV